MPIFAEIVSGGTPLKLNELGQLSVAPYDYQSVVQLDLDSDNDAFNFFPPIVGKQFIISGILLSAGKTVTTDVDVDIYESSAADDTTIDKSIFSPELLKSERLPLIPLNIKVTEGKWLNAKANDSVVKVSIFGFYVPVVS